MNLETVYDANDITYAGIDTSINDSTDVILAETVESTNA